MSTVLHPVGPQRARVYWVRRLLVLLVVVALVVLATTAVSWLRGGGDDGAAAATGAGQSAGGASGTAASAGEGDDAAEDDAGDGGPTAGDDDGADDASSDDAEPGPEAPVDCTPEALQLTLTSADVEFDAGTSPVLTATVTNVGDEPCTVDAGDAAREVVISSGDDRVWSTADCASEDSASRQLLLGDGAADAVEIEWDRVRSADGCPSGLPEPRAGTYQAVATLGELSSQTVVFILG